MWIYCKLQIECGGNQSINQSTFTYKARHSNQQLSKVLYINKNMNKT